jgi:hypothetical protein
MESKRCQKQESQREQRSKEELFKLLCCSFPSVLANEIVAYLSLSWSMVYVSFSVFEPLCVLRVCPLSMPNVEMIRTSLPSVLKKEHANCRCPQLESLLFPPGCTPSPVCVQVSGAIYSRSTFLQVASTMIWNDDAIYQSLVSSVKETHGIRMVWEPQTREPVSTSSFYWKATLAVQTADSERQLFGNIESDWATLVIGNVIKNTGLYKSDHISHIWTKRDFADWQAISQKAVDVLDESGMD